MLFSCHRDPTPVIGQDMLSEADSIGDYFPLEIGNSWEYFYFYSRGSLRDHLEKRYGYETWELENLTTQDSSQVYSFNSILEGIRIERVNRNDTVYIDTLDIEFRSKFHIKENRQNNLTIEHPTIGIRDLGARYLNTSIGDTVLIGEYGEWRDQAFKVKDRGLGYLFYSEDSSGYSFTFQYGLMNLRRN